MADGAQWEKHCVRHEEDVGRPGSGKGQDRDHAMRPVIRTQATLKEMEEEDGHSALDVNEDDAISAAGSVAPSVRPGGIGDAASQNSAMPADLGPLMAMLQQALGGQVAGAVPDNASQKTKKAGRRGGGDDRKS